MQSHRYIGVLKFIMFIGRMFIDNGGLLVPFRCLGVRTDLPVYVRSIPACALHLDEDGLGSS